MLLGSLTPALNQVREADAAHAEEIRRQAKETKEESRAPPKSRSLKEIESGLSEGEGLVAFGGEVTTVTRHAPTTGPTISHYGSEKLPDALERDLAKVKRDSASARVEKHIEGQVLEGMCIDGIRFEKNGFCSKDVFETFKRKEVKIGTKEGSYKKTFSGAIAVTFKEMCYTHINWTDGKASKREKIRPLEHATVTMP